MRISLITLALAGLLCAGCIDYTEKLSLNPDGSGEISMHFVVDKSYTEELRALSRQMGMEDEDPMSALTDEICPEEELRASLDSLGGLELLRYDMQETEETLTLDLAFRFASQEDFRKLAWACPEGDEDPQAAADEWSFTYVKQDDGLWLYSRDFAYAAQQGDDMFGAMQDDASWTGEDEEYAEPDDEQPSGDEADTDTAEADEPDEALTDPEALARMFEEMAASGDTIGVAEMQAMAALYESMQRMSESASQHRVRIEVKFPGRIVESNATRTQGQVAVWEYTLDRLQEAPGVIEASIEP